MDWDAYRSPIDSILEATGRTPLVRLRRVSSDGVDLLAKVEWYAPTGSVKDRIYDHMFGCAERRGDLRPGMTIIECTTGNAGIACSAVAAIRGYPCVIVMPEGMSEERKRMIEAYGADLVLTPGAGTDITLALARMREIVADDPERYFFPGEFDNPDNVDAQAHSGEEIWQQTGGRLAAIVAATGTGGWISGVARAIKAHDASVRIYAVEPTECPLLSQRRWGPHGVPGIADGIVPGNLDLAAIDGVVTISTEDALEMARRLAREEGLLCGPSSGINVAGALKVSRAHPEMRRVVTVVADTGQRYLSGELLAPAREARSPRPLHGIEPEARERLDAHLDRLELLD
jgi:cysteine synthase